MAINERLIHTAAEAAAGTEEGLILHLDANDVDSYDGDGSVWYDISDHEYTPATDVSEHFNTVLYTATTNSLPVTGVGFQPDLIWLKSRDNSYNHSLYDSVRGASGYALQSNTNIASSNTSGINGLTSFDTDGFTLAAKTASVSDNSNFTSGSKAVAWCFKAGGAPTASNPYMIDGTGYATLSAAGLADDGDLDLHEASINTKLGFGIYRFDPNNVSGETASFEHGLGATPELVITKSASGVFNWWTFTNQIDGSWDYLKLNDTDAKVNDTITSGAFADATTMRFAYGFTGDSSNHVAYAFTSKRGVSKIGSYKGTGSSGNKVYTGFEPAWLMVKETSSTGNWRIMDNVRDTDNPKNLGLWANLNNAENSSSTNIVDFNGDGFTIKGSGSDVNTSSQNYIYLAFAAKKPDSLANKKTSVAPTSDYSSITSTSTHSTDAPGLTDSSSTSSIHTTTNQVRFGNTGNSANTNNFTVTMGAAFAAKGFAVYETYQSGYKYTGTVDFYGSNDNTNFTLLGTSVQNTTVQQNRNEVTFSNDTEYLYYKFDFHSNTRGTYQNFWAIEILKEIDFSPELHLDPASYSGSGTTWTADVGNDGTLVGNTSYDEELGDFFDLDGSGDYISLNTAGYLDGDFTLEMWWNFDSFSSGYQMLWGGQGYSGGTGLGAYIYGNGTLWTYISVGGSASAPMGQSGTVLTVGKWHHIVTTRSGGTYTNYVDGVQIQTGTGSTTSLASTNTTIGKHYNATLYDVDGRVGQVRVYDSALSSDQVMQNYRFTKNDYPNGFNGDFVNMSSSDWNSSGYFDFNGTSQTIKIDATAHSPIDFSKQNYTISAWINPDSVTGNHPIMSKYGTSDSARAIIFRVQNGVLNLYERGGNNQVTGTSSVVANSWQHVVLVRTADEVIFYINNVAETIADTNSSATNGGSQRITIGKHESTTPSYFDGLISDVKLFDKPLTNSEITAEYNKGQFGNN